MDQTCQSTLMDDTEERKQVNSDQQEDSFTYMWTA